MSGRIRTLKPEWLEDEKMALLPDHIRLMTIQLKLVADDYGRGRANVGLLAGLFFPVSEEAPERFARSVAKVREGLSKLVEDGYLRLYEVRGQRYFEIVNWAKHEKVDKPGKPRVPLPSEAQPRETSSERLPGESARETPENFRETHATDHDHDHDHEEDHDPRNARGREPGRDAPAFDPKLGCAEPPPPKPPTPTLPEIRAVIAAFESAWAKHHDGRKLGLNVDLEQQRAIDVWRKAFEERPSDPLSLLREAAVAACATPSFRRLGSPWAAFVRSPWRNLVPVEPEEQRPGPRRGMTPPSPASDFKPDGDRAEDVDFGDDPEPERKAVARA